MAKEIHREIVRLPPDKRAESLKRVARNHRIYFAAFHASNQTRCKVIHELEPEIVLAETERKLERSRNDISHVGFSIGWARRNGRIVYEDGT